MAAAPAAPGRAQQPIEPRGVACVLRDSEAIPAPDARTAAQLVCEALRDAGATVDVQPVAERGTRAAYEVSLKPLGRLVILQAGFRNAAGELQRSETLQLHHLEEVPVAAKRMAEALRRGSSIGETEKVDNLVGEDARQFVKRRGETFFGVGMFGFMVPSLESSVSGYGVFGRFHFQTPSFAASVEARAGGSGESDGDAFLGGLAVGGRWFWFDGNFTPFLGAGLGISWLSADNRRGDHLRGSGFAPFAEIGFELLRLYASRMDMFVRIDIPTFDLERSGDDDVRYAPPVSLMASYSFD